MLKVFRTAAGAAVLTFGVAACGPDRTADDQWTDPATAPAPAPEPAPMTPAPYDPAAPGVHPADTLAPGQMDPAAPGAAPGTAPGTGTTPGTGTGTGGY
jgi:hypothetical protein